MEALLGLSLDGAGPATKQPTAAAAGAVAVEDDIDALLALGAGPPKAHGAAAISADPDDVLDDLLTQPVPQKAPPPPQQQKGGKTKLSSSMLDSGGY